MKSSFIFNNSNYEASNYHNFLILGVGKTAIVENQKTKIAD